MSSPNMKAGDLKPCAICGKGMMHNGIPLFFRVTIEHMGIDRNEVQRSHGMEQFMGGHVALARVFHDPDIAKRLFDPVQVLVCTTCSNESRPLLLLTERTGG